ncbi:hypothetical protein CI793_00910 [Anoxybacillus ayderensis]|nr:hypothetical protein B379_08855 [Anoxybacillus ayderensis G10]THD17858.1 hypothetical protein CI793_00910 [Anoxybacillus ayderensis]
MKRVFLFFIVFSLLCGCDETSIQQKKYIAIPTCSENKECKILYNRFTQKLVAYDFSTNTIKQQTNQPNYIVYAFSTKSPYYTAGDSTGRDFSLFTIKGNEIEKVYDGRKGEAIFPLADDGNYHVFIRMYLDNDGEEVSRSIIRWDEKEKSFIKYSHVKGLVSYGAIMHEKLYYTVYEPYKDYYTMYVLDLSNENNQPRLVESGLKAGELYVIDGALYRSDEEKIYADNGRTFKKKLINYIDKENRLLIQMYPNSDGDLLLDIIQVETNKKIVSVKDVIDFSTERGKVIVYSQEGRKEIIVR